MLWSDFQRVGRFFDPWREFERLNRTISRTAYPSTSDFPQINIWMSDEEAILTSEIPGVNTADIEITVVGRSVTLKMSRDPLSLAEGEAFHRRERWYGRFSRSVELPFAIDADKVQAQYTNGILTVTLHRAESEKPRKVAVKSE